MDQARRVVGQQAASEEVVVIEDVVCAYLELADSEAPGLIEGLYLTGSAVLDDFRPNTSDIDFVAVTAADPGSTAIAALARIHAKLRNRFPRPFFDGVYITWSELKREPDQSKSGPHVLEGRFRSRGNSSRNLITWETLAHYGIARRGPPPAALDVWTNPQALARWTLNNLDTYWRDLLDRSSHFRNPRSWIALTSYGAVWIVLGVSRLHYTLTTGKIVSKEGAGIFSLQTFPEEWHLVVNECLRIRRADKARPAISSMIVEMTGSAESLYATPFSRRRDVLAFGNMVIADAHRRYRTY
jgi:hypothetical protein